eukprot:6181694-Pleurochrysis_carterae.AAC.2
MGLASPDEYNRRSAAPDTVHSPLCAGSRQSFCVRFAFLVQEAIGVEVSNAIIKFINSGITYGTVNFPEIDIAQRPGTHRLLNVHKNVPGVLSKASASTRTRCEHTRARACTHTRVLTRARARTHTHTHPHTHTHNDTHSMPNPLVRSEVTTKCPPPSLLAQINTALCDADVNIVQQQLGTNESIGYLVVDMASESSELALSKIKELDTSIRTRVLW